MAPKSGFGSHFRVWLSLLLALSAGIAVCSWQSEVQSRRDRLWALKTADESDSLVVHQTPVIRKSQKMHPPESAAKPLEIAANTTPSVESLSEAVYIPSAQPDAPVQQPLLPAFAGPVVNPVVSPSPAATPENLLSEVAAERPAARREFDLPTATAPLPNGGDAGSIAHHRDTESATPSDDAPAVPASPLEFPATEPETEKIPDCFARPTTLCADLEILKETGAFSRFASAVSHELEVLIGHGSFTGPKVQSSLARLEMLKRTGLDLAAAHPHDAAHAAHLRVVHGLTRRLEIWKSAVVVSPAMHQVGLSSTPIGDVAKRLRTDLKSSSTPLAANWERFLLLDEVIAANSGAVLSKKSLNLLERISARAHSENLTEEQRAFLLFGAPRDLIAAIDLYLTVPLTTAELLAELESYEAEPTASRANTIATAIAQMALSQDGDQLAFAEKLANFYRAANVRVAVAESLINRLIPTPQVSNEPVNDHLMGARVTGRSNVSTRLRVNLVPDESSWRVGLEASGNVASNTQAFHGPFTFFNQGWANYRARTTVGLGKNGFNMNQPTVEASSQTDLLDLQSDFDGIPLFGLLARSVARQQHANKQVEAEWEVEGRMARRIEQKLDQELNTQMRKVETEWTSRISQPLHGLRLNPTPIAMETTQDRLIARYRVGGDTQLAAHTARPLAPSDSVLSVQIHVSAINNFIEQLQLNGKTYKLEDLYLHLNKALGSTDNAIPDDMPAGVSVQFADEDALRMDIREGQAELTVRLAEIRQGKTKWKNVQVRGRFTPKTNGLNAVLERTSFVELKGDGLKRIGGGQVILRMAFSSVLSRVSGVPLIHPKLTQHPQLQSYAIRQFDLDDGWIGLAIGPQLSNVQNAPREEKTETARRPRSPVLDTILR